MNTIASVNLWGRRIGAVVWDDTRRLGVFQYTPEFVLSGIQVSPLVMPLREEPWSFPALNPETFRGLPGLLADSLPDRFGNDVFTAWLSYHQRSLESINPVEQLCYIGKRGMGAMEFEPALGERPAESDHVEVASLLDLANRIVNHRQGLKGAFDGVDDAAAVSNILKVGASAGGARAKAVLAWNPATNEFRSGQLPASSGFEDWIIKFDGVAGQSQTLGEPMGFGRIEFAYSEMAKAAGIEMSECRLYQEGGRQHFMTRRFDRKPGGEKLHLQTLGALTHSDYKRAAAYSYEQVLMDMGRLGLSIPEKEQFVLRAMFNVVARNQDDHVKNVSFLMEKDGQWRLSPAYDVTYAYDPENKWTGQHQMLLNGKRDRFTREDLIKLANLADVKPSRAAGMLERVTQAVRRWPEFAASAGVVQEEIEKIKNTFRIDLLV